jgi:hypothetical protein
LVAEAGVGVLLPKLIGVQLLGVGHARCMPTK